jgi:RNA polymerase sigma-70 factor (ECF subfamily)
MARDVSPAALGASFLSRWTPTADTPATADLDVALDQAIAGARAAFPDVVIPAEEFAAYLAERADPSVVPIAALGAMNVNELYLACACGRGQREALATFEATYMPLVTPFIAKIDPAPPFIDEVKQLLRLCVLVGEEQKQDDREPKILRYRGRGSLKGWLGVTAARIAVDLKRKGSGKEISLDDLVVQASTSDPEVNHLRGRYLGDFREVVKKAVVGALESLDPSERNLLRWHLVESLSLRKIAAVRGVHVATIAREYARLRARIMDTVRAALRESSGLPSQDVDSVLGALASRISISIGGVLKKD